MTPVHTAAPDAFRRQRLTLRLCRAAGIRNSALRRLHRLCHRLVSPTCQVQCGDSLTGRGSAALGMESSAVRCSPGEALSSPATTSALIYDARHKVIPASSLLDWRDFDSHSLVLVSRRRGGPWAPGHEPRSGDPHPRRMPRKPVAFASAAVLIAVCPAGLPMGRFWPGAAPVLVVELSHPRHSAPP